jgi:hypothetical protein
VKPKRPIGVVSTNLAIPVTAFACIICTGLYSHEKDADKCCRCAECNGVFPQPVEWRLRGGHATCPRCRYSGRVERARTDLARASLEERRAQIALDKLLEEGRPPPLPEARKRKFAPVEGERGDS